MSVPVGKPLIWLLLGEKLGDNAQVELVAEHLGLPYESRRLVMQEAWKLGKPGFAANLDHIDLEASDRLEAPWPDLILTVGRRPAMAALWVKEQNAGRTRIVLFGRPKKWLDRFSLVVAPAQYGIPPAANVLPIELPLMKVDEARLERGRAEAAQILADMPRPITAVLVGGRTKPYRFGASEARELLSELGARCAADGGSFYFSTSRRTNPEVLEVLARELPANARLFRFGDEEAMNPYAALLAEADRFVVTGDSISMMVEVARLGRPLAIHELPIEGGNLTEFLRRVAFGLSRGGLRGRIGMLLFRLGLLGFARDLGAMHRRLYALGAARPLTVGFSAPDGPAEHEGVAVAARIRALLGPAEARADQLAPSTACNEGATG
ncbi:MAG: mitochondrial fission ELM1 family protein [Planctomycetes bacterium]|nr:mitochondrial fission ELM1 family protein [Planctomycetota bacterium]